MARKQVIVTNVEEIIPAEGYAYEEKWNLQTNSPYYVRMSLDHARAIRSGEECSDIVTLMPHQRD